jgi:aerobic carbon-monoxide dehydrogenase large subunit
MEEYPSPNNPLGAKGAGEGGIVPVAAVIASAIASAIGIQPKSLPLSPPRVWELMNNGGISETNPRRRGEAILR